MKNFVTSLNSCLRMLMFLLVAMALSSCGGDSEALLNPGLPDTIGDVEDEDDSLIPAPESPFEMTLALTRLTTNDVYGTAEAPISNAEPGLLVATLTEDGQPVADEVIRFNLGDGLGVLSPTSGTALTNSSGPE